MSLIFTEGFDWLNGSTTLTQVETFLPKMGWNVVNLSGGATNPVVVSRGTFRGLQLDGTHDIRTNKIQQPDGNTTCIVGFYYKFGSTFAAVDFLQIWCGEREQCVIELNIDGTVDFARSSTILGTSSYSFSTNNEYFIEFKIVISDSVGSIEMKVADLTAGTDTTATATEWTLTGLDNRNSTNSAETAWDSITFHGAMNGSIIDDITICNAAGATNNDFLGNLYVETVEPTGAGASTQLTPSAGANWENVDDAAAPDADSTYNTADANAETDLYEMANPTETAEPLAVQAQIMAKVTQGDPRTVNIPMRSGSTTTDGSNIMITDTEYTGRLRIEEEKIDGGAWTNAAVNSLQIGIKRVS